MFLFLSIFVLLPTIQSQWSYYDQRYIQCYSCSDCPESFFLFHAQITLTPPDTGQCMKTVVRMPNSGRYLISKGFSRNCVPEWSLNIQVYCCYYNLCNRSNALSSSILVTFILSTMITLSMNTELIS